MKGLSARAFFQIRGMEKKQKKRGESLTAKRGSRTLFDDGDV